MIMIGSDPMDKLMQLIDKYLVPVYNKDGWIPVAVFLVIVGAMVAASIYFGYGAIVARFFQ